MRPFILSAGRSRSSKVGYLKTYKLETVCVELFRLVSEACLELGYPWDRDLQVTTREQIQQQAILSQWYSRELEQGLGALPCIRLC